MPPLVMLALIAMPGGSGKTTLCARHPDKFQDLDVLVWRFAGMAMRRAIDTGRADLIPRIYEHALIRHRGALDPSKVVLAHHQSHALPLGASCVARIRPSRGLWEAGLSPAQAAMARAEFDAVGPAEEYGTHEAIERRCLDLFHSLSAASTPSVPT